MQIDRDFEAAFPESANGLFNNWEDIQPKVLSLAEQMVQVEDFGPQLRSLGIDLTLDGMSTMR